MYIYIYVFVLAQREVPTTISDMIFMTIDQITLWQ